MVRRNHPAGAARGTARALAAAVLFAILASGTGSADEWVTVAEGWSSVTPETPILAGYRLFTAMGLRELCRSGASAPRLTVESPLHFQAGHGFRWSSIRVAATGGNGQPLAPIPLAIDIIDAQAILPVNSQTLNEGLFTPAHAGTFRIRVRSLCEPPAETLVDAVVN